MPYDAVVDEAITFGWVDSRPGTVDEDRSRRLMTPRRPGSSWSKVNKDRVERLTAEGRMSAAGLRTVERAQADGSWSVLDRVETLEEPEDLRAALDADPAARADWNGFPRSTRRAILEWIGTAKRPETRAKRIAQTAADAARGVRANHWRQPGDARPAR